MNDLSKNVFMYWAGVFPALLLFIVSCSKSNGGDEDAIRMQREKSNESIALRDTASMGSLFTENYVMISSRDKEVHGKRGAQQLFMAEFTLRPSVSYVRTPSRIRVFTAWNMAAEDGRWVGTWQDGEEKIQVWGTYSAKWHKVNNACKIRSEVFVPLQCKGGSYCNQSPI